MTARKKPAKAKGRGKADSDAERLLSADALEFRWRFGGVESPRLDEEVYESAGAALKVVTGLFARSEEELGDEFNGELLLVAYRCKPASSSLDLRRRLRFVGPLALVCDPPDDLTYNDLIDIFASAKESTPGQWFWPPDKRGLRRLNRLIADAYAAYVSAVGDALVGAVGLMDLVEADRFVLRWADIEAVRPKLRPPRSWVDDEEEA